MDLGKGKGIMKDDSEVRVFKTEEEFRSSIPAIIVADIEGEVSVGYCQSQDGNGCCPAECSDEEKRRLGAAKILKLIQGPTITEHYNALGIFLDGVTSTSSITLQAEVAEPGTFLEVPSKEPMRNSKGSKKFDTSNSKNKEQLALDKGSGISEAEELHRREYDPIYVDQVGKIIFEHRNIHLIWEKDEENPGWVLMQKNKEKSYLVTGDAVGEGDSVEVHKNGMIRYGRILVPADEVAKNSVYEYRLPTEMDMKEEFEDVPISQMDQRKDQEQEAVFLVEETVAEEAVIDLKDATREYSEPVAEVVAADEAVLTAEETVSQAEVAATGKVEITTTVDVVITAIEDLFFGSGEATRDDPVAAVEEGGGALALEGAGPLAEFEGEYFAPEVVSPTISAKANYLESIATTSRPTTPTPQKPKKKKGKKGKGKKKVKKMTASIDVESDTCVAEMEMRQASPERRVNRSPPPLTYLQRADQWKSLLGLQALDRYEVFEQAFRAHVIVAEALVTEPEAALTARQRSLFLKEIEAAGFDNKGHTNEEDLCDYSFEQADRFASYLPADRLRSGLSRADVVEVDEDVRRHRKGQAAKPIGHILHYDPHKYFRRKYKNHTRKIAYLYCIYPELTHLDFPEDTDELGNTPISEAAEVFHPRPLPEIPAQKYFAPPPPPSTPPPPPPPQSPEVLSPPGFLIPHSSSEIGPEIYWQNLNDFIDQSRATVLAESGLLPHTSEPTQQFPNSTMVTDLNFTLPSLPEGWSAEKDFKVLGHLTKPTERSIEPVGPHFLAHARRARHKRTFSEDDRIQAEQNVKKVEDDDSGEISEPEDSMMLARDAKDWKGQDHYAVLGLSKYRYKATEEQIKRAHRKKVLRHHPDKKAAAGSTEDDSFFKCIQKATEILLDPVKRRQFDSVDEHAEVEAPTKKQAQGANFYKLWARTFKAEGRFSIIKPVPKFGDENSTKEEVDEFYNFFYNFSSWRSFEYQDEDVPDDNENRDQKRHVERKNNNARKKKKTEDSARLRHLVDECLAQDERIKKFRQAASANKNKKKFEREAAEKKAAEEAKAKKEAEEKAKKDAEESAKVEREQGKKAKEAAKNAVKKNKRVLKGSVKDANYFASGEASAAQIDIVLNDVELIQGKIDPDEIAALAGKLNGLKVASEIKGVWAAEAKRLVGAGKIKEGEAKSF